MQPSEEIRLILPSRLGQAAARPLWQSLLDAAGSHLVLDARDVEHLGGQCGQILIAGRRTWIERGHSFTIVDPSESFAEGIQLLGLQTHLHDTE